MRETGPKGEGELMRNPIKILTGFSILCFVLLHSDSTLGARYVGKYVSGALGAFTVGNSRLEGDQNGANAAASPVGLSGIAGFGMDFEYRTKSYLGFGGMFRYYSTSDTILQTKFKYSLLVAGPFVKAHLPMKHLDFSIGAGLVVANPSYTQTTELDADMGFGTDFTIGVLYRYNSHVFFGIENRRIFALGSELNGMLVSDWMLKFQYFL